MINITEIENIIRVHMESQPYKAKCFKCGGPVEFEISIDNDLDLIIEVYPCKCTKREQE